MSAGIRIAICAACNDVMNSKSACKFQLILDKQALLTDTITNAAQGKSVVIFFQGPCTRLPEATALNRNASKQAPAVSDKEQTDVSACGTSPLTQSVFVHQLRQWHHPNR